MLSVCFLPTLSRWMDINCGFLETLRPPAKFQSNYRPCLLLVIPSHSCAHTSETARCSECFSAQKTCRRFCLEKCIIPFYNEWKWSTHWCVRHGPNNYDNVCSLTSALIKQVLVPIYLGFCLISRTTTDWICACSQPHAVEKGYASIWDMKLLFHLYLK